MNERNLVICDSELHYAHRLGENISERNELAVKVFICTDLNNVRRFQQNRQIHMLVLGEKNWMEERQDIKAEQIFILTSEMGLDLEQNEKEVYRFQSADMILEEIFETYSEKTNQNILKQVRKAKQKVIAVYSPIHRIGKTSFAIALGKELAREAKTLYLNLESYADIGGRFRRVEGRNLGDLIYYMKQENGNISLRLSTMVTKIGDLDYVPPITMSTDLHEIPLEEWQMLLVQILQNSVYENIILDMGEGVQGLFEILQMCDRIYMPVLEDAVSIRKLEQFDENLRRLDLAGVRQSIYRFTAVGDMEEYAKKIVKEEQ